MGAERHLTRPRHTGTAPALGAGAVLITAVRGLVGERGPYRPSTFSSRFGVPEGAPEILS